MRPDVSLCQHFPIIIGRQRQFHYDLNEPLRKRMKVASIHYKYNYIN